MSEDIINLELKPDADLSMYSYCKAFDLAFDAEDRSPETIQKIPVSELGRREEVLIVNPANKKVAKGIAKYWNRVEKQNVRVVLDPQKEIDEWSLDVKSFFHKAMVHSKGA